MAVRKKTTRTPRRSSKKGSKGITFGHIALVCLGAAAIIGWYTSFYESDSTKSKIVATTTVYTKTPSQKPTTQKTVSDLIVENNIAYTRAPIPSITSKQATQPLQVAKSAIPPAPYKQDTSLPPQGRFGIHNAANAVYALNKTIIYDDAQNSAKVVAIINKGQEMRSYEKKGEWQRIVVPTTDIIGWAKSNELTSSNIVSQQRDIQNIKTGSINNNR